MRFGGADAESVFTRRRVYGPDPHKTFPIHDCRQNKVYAQALGEQGIPLSRS
jgi:hypothetical protein